jgi:hypothetical protein
MRELEADPDYQKRRRSADATRHARIAEDATEFALVQRALDVAGLPSEDFGRFTSGRHPDIIRPAVFDYRRAVPVLLAVLPQVSSPNVKEAIVRSLSTAYARPIAAEPLLAEFRGVDDKRHPALKWAIGNALASVTTAKHVDVLLDLALDPKHGAGRAMIVERLGRISRDARVIDALVQLIDDEQVALMAMAALQRRLGPAAAAARIQPLIDHPSERVRYAARQQLVRAERALTANG